MIELLNPFLIIVDDGSWEKWGCNLRGISLASELDTEQYLAVQLLCICDETEDEILHELPG